MSASTHPLRFSISALRESQGFSTSLQLSPSLLLDSPVDDCKLDEPVDINLEFSMGGDLILLQARVSGAWILECSRCLTVHGASFDTGTEETFPIASETIDVTTALRDAILMEVPQRSLCRPDCKGLCPSCGKNLNESACPCVNSGEKSFAAKNKKSPFEALKKLKK